jgi:hypothetical protein
MDVNLPEKCGLVLRVIFNFSVKFLKIENLLTAMFLSSFLQCCTLARLREVGVLLRLLCGLALLPRLVGLLSTLMY